MLWSLIYLVVRNLFALVWLLGRPRRSKELEILVLRHELAVLRRQAARPKLTRADRVLLAALSRSLPRTVWPSFPVKPETLLRWHRERTGQTERAAAAARQARFQGIFLGGDQEPPLPSAIDAISRAVESANNIATRTVPCSAAERRATIIRPARLERATARPRNDLSRHPV